MRPYYLISLNLFAFPKKGAITPFTYMKHSFPAFQFVRFWLVCLAVCFSSFSGLLQAQISQTFNAPGASSFTVPAGVTSITVEAWGGGGGGSSRFGAAAGGGGGAYTKGTLTVTPGSTLNFTVGAGGTAGNAGTNSVISTIVASGGSSSNSRTGGAGGAASVIGGNIILSYAGGDGGDAAPNTGGGGSNEAGGGGGGSAFTNATGNPGTNGGNSTTTATAGGTGTGNGGNGAAADGNPAATAGTAPGGGGGGRSEGGSTSQSGATGRVIITYYPPTISGVSPASACAGSNTLITISGTNFTSGAIIKFSSNSTATTTFVNSTTLTTTVPAGAITGAITVTTSGGSANSSSFTVNPVPTVNAGSPVAAICSGQSTTALNGSFGGAATGAIWSSNAGGSFTPSATSLNASWTPPVGYSGTAKLYFTSSGGSCSAAVDSVTQLVNPLPVPAFQGGVAASSCINSVQHFEVQSGQSAYVWTITGVAGTDYTIVSGGTGFYSLDVQWLSVGSKSVTASFTSVAGCTAAVPASVNLTVHDLPVTGAISGEDDVCMGSNTSLTVNPTGSGPFTLNWNSSNPSHATVNASGLITGLNSGTSTITCTVTDINGCSAVSAGFEVEIKARPSAVLNSNTQTICKGTSISLSGNVTAHGLWQLTLNNGAVLSGEDDAGFISIQVPLSSTNYSIVSLIDEHCSAIPFDWSGTYQVVVHEPVSLITQPVGSEVCSSYPASMQLIATGDSIFVQWYRMPGVMLNNNSLISGAQQPTLSWSQTNPSDQDSYYAVVGGAYPCPAVTTDTIQLIVNESVQITSQPLAQIVCEGTSANFSVTANAGGDPLTFQWRRNGIDIPSATNSTFTLPVAALADGGSYDVVVSNSAASECANAFSAAVSLTVVPVTIPGTLSGSTHICVSGNSGTLNLHGFRGSVQQWEYSIDNGASWQIVASTDSFLNYSNVTVTTRYRVLVKNNVCSAAYSTEAILTPDSSPVGGTISGSTHVCSTGNSGSLTLSGTSGSISGWEYSVDNGVSWIAVSNTTNVYSYSNILNTQLVRATIANGVCPVMYSDTASLQVDVAPVAGTLNSNGPVCSGVNSVQLVLAGFSGSISNWESSADNGSSWQNISYTNATYDASNLTQSTLYRVVLSSGVCAVLKTDTLRVAVYQPTVAGTISADATVCSSVNSGTLTLTGHSGAVIRWESSVNNGVSWNNISNTSTSQNYSNLTQTTLYRAVVQNGVCTQLASSPVTITVQPPTVGGTLSGTATVCSGLNSGTLNLSGQTGSVQQWEYSIDAGLSWLVINQTTNSYNYSNLTQTTRYRALVKSGVCNATYSSVAIITVNPLPAATVANTATNVCFKTTAQTTTLSYSGAINSPTQYSISWNASPANSFVVVTNAALVAGSVTLNVPASTTAGTYTGILTLRNANGCVSNPYTFTVTVNPTPQLTITPASQTICPDANITSMALGNSNALTGVTYSWTRTTPAGITGTVAASASSLPDGSVINGAFSNSNTTATNVTFTLNATSSLGCAATAITSVVTVNAPVTITTQPVDKTVCAGTSTSFTVVASGTGLSYQWRKGTVNLVNGGSVSGATSATLTINPVALADASTDYNCVVTSGSCMSVITNYVTLTVNAAAATPTNQPLALVFPTVATTSILGTFTASASASNYLVIRTATNTQPANPVNGTVYTVGTNALGGYVEYSGTSNIFTSNGLSPNTTYYFWVYAYNTSLCGTSPLYMTTSPLNGPVTTATTIACGTVATLYWGGAGSSLTGRTNGTDFNTASNWSTSSPNYTASPVVPSQCNNVIINLTSDATLKLSGNASVYNFTFTVNGSNDVVSLSVEGKTLTINGNTVVDVLGGNGNTQISFGELGSGAGVVDCKANARFGETNLSGPATILVGNASSKFIFRGDILLGRTAAMISPGGGAPTTGTTPGTIEFDGTGLQQILWNNNYWFDNFYNVVVGNQNQPYLRHVTGSYLPDNILNNLTINNGATVDLAKSQWIRDQQGGTFTMNGTAKLILGNNLSQVSPATGRGVVIPGSNFPGGFSTLSIATTSTIEYNADASITQTVYGTPSVGTLTYGNLILSNVGGTGTAPKISTSAIQVAGSMKVQGLTQFTPGATVNTTAAGTTVNVQNTGSWYAGTNLVTGAGTFTLESGGTLAMGAAAGITQSGATGNIQTTTRSFSTGGNYIYNGAVAQNTGNGLPYTMNNLTVQNATGVTLFAASKNYTVNNKLFLTSGNLMLNGDSLTINQLQRSSGLFYGSNASSLIVKGSGVPLFFAGAGSLLRHLRIEDNASADIQSNIDISAGANAGSVYAGNAAILNTYGRLTLKSDAAGTARIAALPVNGGGVALATINGNITIERYIPPRRAWRLLTVPVKATGAPTFNAAWQEGVVNPTYVYANRLDPNPGFGMHITGSSPALGFDASQNNNPSVKYYNQATDTWLGIPNTLSAKVTDSSGYMVFVRGNRSTQIQLNVGAPVNPTVLRASGQIKTGLQPIAISGGAGSYRMVGNPFASAIDLKQLNRAGGISDGFVVWDPNLTGTYSVGAYQYLTKSGADYTVFPGGGSFGAAFSVVNEVQSGQAFLVQQDGSGGTLGINENAKISSSSLLALRPGSPASVPGHIGMTLHYAEADSTLPIADGALVLLSDDYNNGTDAADFKKAINISENISVVAGNDLLAVTKRKPLQPGDTIQYRLTKLKARDYQFHITTEQAAPDGMELVLEDRYLNRLTAVPASGELNYRFTVTVDSGAWHPLRFRLLYRSYQVLPVQFSMIRATKKPQFNWVEWAIASAENIRSYRIERASNGRTFIPIGNVPAGNSRTATYSWEDHAPLQGDNYYRIAAIESDGSVKYSSIVRLKNQGVQEAVIAPNPVTNGLVQLHLNGYPSGKYQMRISNSAGQVIYTSEQEIQAGSLVIPVQLQSNLIRGNYQLEWFDAQQHRTVIPFTVQ